MDGADPRDCCSPFAGEALTDEQAATTAALFRALGDPRRVRLVSLLASRGEPACVGELTGPLGLGQPTVSHHLKKLQAAGLVSRQQRGRWAYYSLRRDVAACLARLMTAGAHADPADADAGIVEATATTADAVPAGGRDHG